MKLSAWNGLSLRIIALFATAMLMSYSPALFRDWLFEDTKIQPDSFGHVWLDGMVDREYDWGYRHYLYFWMCVILFIVQAARLFKWIGKNEKEFK